jgi:hypothetical protein
MPFKAERRHQYWSAGAIRFAETNEKPFGDGEQGGESP